MSINVTGCNCFLLTLLSKKEERHQLDSVPTEVQPDKERNYVVTYIIKEAQVVVMLHRQSQLRDAEL